MASRPNDDCWQFIQFSRTYLRFVEGERGGAPLEFEPWQLAITNRILSRNADTGLRNFTTAYVGLPKGNNKSTWGAALALYFLCWESAHSGDKGMQVYAIAASRDQAKIVFNNAKRMVEASPRLQQWVTVTRDSIYVKRTGATFQVLSSDAPKTQGKRPSIVICDELHAHENGDLYEAMETAMITRREPLMVVITNAGADEENSKCGEVYRRGKQGTDPTMFFYSPSVPDDQLDDPAAWKLANPLSIITVDRLKALRKKMPPFVFERFHLNRWTRAEKEWLPPGAWEACAGTVDIPDGAPAVAAIDMARRSDSAALVVVYPRHGKYQAIAETWATWADPSKPPPTATHVIEGDTIPFDAPMNRIRELCAQLNVYEVAYDPWRFDYPAEVLSSEGIPMVEHPQSPERMCNVSQGLFDVIVEGLLIHGDDPNFTIQIKSSVAKEVGAKWRLDKSKNKNHMDAAVALAMAVDRARFYMDADEADYDFRTL